MRYVLIDYMHLAHRCIVAEPLSATVVVNGEVDVKDTTIPTYTIKWIFGYGGKGLFHTGVFLEGGSDFRKNHFAKKGTTDGKGYKGSRPHNKGSFYEGIELAKDIMLKGKVSLYRAQGYEADDLIYSAIQKIKETDTTTPIDVITNDSDLLPLVDEQVSVYIRGTRQFSEDGCPEHRLYYQVTPRTWDEYLEYTSAYKGYNIPYNSMLLFKLIRGDKSDNVEPAVQGYGKVKYSETMEQMKNSVFMDKSMEELLKKYFIPKKESIVDINSVLQEVSERYTGKDKEKFLEQVEQKLRGEVLNKRTQNSMIKKIEKDSLGDILDFEKIESLQDELTKWFDMTKRIEMNNSEINLKDELLRVLEKHFTQNEISQMFLEGLNVENIFTYGVDFENIFRYGVDFDTVIRPSLEPWFTNEEVENMKFIYEGIGLRRVNLYLPKQIDRGYLQQYLDLLRINLPR